MGTQPAALNAAPITAVDEWLECRRTIDRFDRILADLRKFGFTLITGLLTANALVHSADRASDAIVASILVMALVLALFMVDRYYWVLLRETVKRTNALERKEDKITHQLSAIARRSYANWVASALYAAFIVFAAFVPAWLNIPLRAWANVAVTMTAAGVSLVVIYATHLFTTWLFDPIALRRGLVGGMRRKFAWLGGMRRKLKAKICKGSA